MAHTYIQNNLKALRKRAGWRQHDLAVLLGIESFDRVSKWEMGLCYPSLEYFSKLLRLFTVRPVDIYPELFSDVNEKNF